MSGCIFVPYYRTKPLLYGSDMGPLGVIGDQRFGSKKGQRQTIRPSTDWLTDADNYTIHTNKDTADIVVFGVRILGSWRRRLVEIVERYLYLTVMQPARPLVVAVNTVESLDVHPQLDKTPARRVDQVPTKLAHARHAAHCFCHPTDNVMAHCGRPHIICA